MSLKRLPQAPRFSPAPTDFGASAVALNRLTGYYGYVPVAVDEKGVNIFYVHE